MISIAIEAAREAGRHLAKHAGRAQRIEHKQGQATNLVTEVDREAEDLIIGMIRQKYPDHSFLAEESPASKGASDFRWIIDPLDGTTNFAHGLPIFCTSIALEHQGQVIIGVIYDPMRDELFVAERGKGARLNDRPIQVSQTNKLIESLVVTGFPYDLGTNPGSIVGHFIDFLHEARAVRRLGSAALDLCYVACGRFDGYWEVRLNPWDMAAGILLVEEAGGKYTNLTGAASTIYHQPVLASNGRIHDQMARVLARRLQPPAKGHSKI